MSIPGNPGEPIIPPGTNAIIVIGRPLSDYAVSGVPVPLNKVIHACLGCGQAVAISEGANERLLNEGRAPGVILAGAMCELCGMRATAVAGGKPNILATANGAKRMAESPVSAAYFDELKKKAERPKGKP